MNFKIRRYVCNGLCAVNLLGASTLAMGDPGDIDAKLAGQYFREARAICSRDAGRLWGVTVCGPMLFVDPASRAVVANQPDHNGLLRKREGVFTGQFPADKIIANTATRWAGTDWAMIMWPLPQDERGRGRLMAHEAWHRVQPGLLQKVEMDPAQSASNSPNGHLDTRDGRVYLQLEWRALEAALPASGQQRRTCVEDALVFRAYRRSLFPNSAAQERGLELNEGLAEFTGIRLAAKSDSEAIDDAIAGLRKGAKRETFVRSFAYASGPAYGLLLDDAAPGWRKGMTLADDMGELTRSALSIVLPTALQAEAQRRAKRYDGEQLAAGETERETARQQRLAQHRARFVDGPILVIPLRGPNVQFNPSNLQPFGDLGTVYPTMTLTDAWGMLIVTKGALLNTGWSEVRVTAPKNTTTQPIKGEGWTLELKKGWTLQAGKRTGDYLVVRSKGG